MSLTNNQAAVQSPVQNCAIAPATASQSTPPKQSTAPAAKTKKPIGIAATVTKPVDPLLIKLPAPGNFTLAELADLKASGISEEAAKRNRICHVTAAEAKALTGHNHAGLLFPFHDERGQLIPAKAGVRAGLPYCRLKLETPLIGKDGRRTRYLTAEGAGVEIYFPVEPLWESNEEFAATRRRRRQWAKKIYITEGEKKAIALSEAGLCCIGISGVNCSTVRANNETEHELHPALTRALINGGDTTNTKAEILFFLDSDASTKPEVAGAAAQFGKTFLDAAFKQGEDRGGAAGVMAKAKAAHRVKFFVLAAELADTERVVIGDRANDPKNLKNGGDDWIVRHGAESLKNIAGCAIPLMVARKTSKLDLGISYVCAFSPTPWVTPNGKGVLPEAKTMRSLLIATLSARFLARKDKSYRWFNGQIWEAADADHIETLPSAVADENGWADRFSITPTREAAIAVNYTLKKKRIDWNPGHLLAFQNGVLNLKDNKLSPFSDSLAITQQLGFSYTPGAVPARFLKFLQEILGTDDQVDLARAFIRASLEPKARFKNRKYDYGFIMYLLGDPGTGKGTFIQIVMDLLGESAAAFDAEFIGDSQGVAPDLIDKNLIVDTDHKGGFGRKEIGRINKIASNEAVPIRHLYVNRYSARLNTILAIVGNEPPQLSGSDRGGFGRRCKYLTFQKRQGSADEGLLTKLQTELPGIYNWAMGISFDEAISTVKGYRMDSATATELAESSDPFVTWLMEAVTKWGGIRKPLSELMEDQTDWFKKANAKPFGLINFKKRLIASGAVEDRDGDRKRVIVLPESVEAVIISGATGMPVEEAPKAPPKESPRKERPTGPPPPLPIAPASVEQPKASPPAPPLPSPSDTAKKAIAEKLDYAALTVYIESLPGEIPALYMANVTSLISTTSPEAYQRIAQSKPET